MRKKIWGILFAASLLCASDRTVTFEKIFGGDEDDIAYSVTASNNGYIVAGKSKSFSDHRDFDAYVVGIDRSGTKLWSKIYGGEDDEVINDIIRYGRKYAFIGSTETFGNGRLSYYFGVIDGEGNRDWVRVYYRDEDDEYYGNSIATNGKELLVAGTERHLTFMSSKINPLIAKLDQDGMIEWRGYYGGKDEDYANKVIPVSDGWMIAGRTETFGHGDFDMYLFKLDKNGKKSWYGAYGGKDDDTAHDLIKLKDGYLLVGTTDSFGLNRDDVFVVRTDKQGKVRWQRTYGGDRDDEGYAVAESPDGGFVIVGRTESFRRHSGFDLYLFKIDGRGEVKWERIYGGESDDAGRDIIATDGGYLIVGDKKTKISRDSNLWILKVDQKGKL